MYMIVAGGGKVGANLARSLLDLGNEVTLVEQRRDRFERLELEFEHQVQRGDATELYVLERAGITRPPDVLLAVTGDDEDNMVIGQLAQNRFGIACVVVRLLDPARADFYSARGMRIVCPTKTAIDTLMEAVRACEIPAGVEEQA